MQLIQLDTTASPPNTYHFISQNSIYSILIQSYEPVQSSQLVIPHFPLDTCNESKTSNEHSRHKKKKIKNTINEQIHVFVRQYNPPPKKNVDLRVIHQMSTTTKKASSRKGAQEKDSMMRVYNTCSPMRNLETRIEGVYHQNNRIKV